MKVFGEEGEPDSLLQYRKSDPKACYEELSP